MTATLLGSFTLGDAMPGVKDALEQTGEALTDIKGVVDSAIGTLGTLQTELNSLASALDSAKDELLLGPVQEIQDAIDSAQGLLDDLDLITDPSAYLLGIIASLNDTIGLLSGLPSAADYLSDAIAAVNAGIDGQQARLDSLASTVSDITDIADDVAAQTALLGELRDTLLAASNATLGGIIAYTEQLSEMLNSGVFVVNYTGPLGTLGSDVDAVLPATGIGTSDDVSGPLLIVRTANTPTLTALNNIFGL